jgi:hypothetical protein
MAQDTNQQAARDARRVLQVLLPALPPPALDLCMNTVFASASMGPRVGGAGPHGPHGGRFRLRRMDRWAAAVVQRMLWGWGRLRCVEKTMAHAARSSHGVTCAPMHVPPRSGHYGMQDLASWTAPQGVGAAEARARTRTLNAAAQRGQFEWAGCPALTSPNSADAASRRWRLGGLGRGNGGQKQ